MSAGQDRDVARDPAGEDQLDPPGLLLAPGGSGDEADPEQREQDRGQEAELVLDDAAEAVDAFHTAVDRLQRAPRGDGDGVGVDLLGGVVQARDCGPPSPPCSGEQAPHTSTARRWVRRHDPEHGRAARSVPPWGGLPAGWLIVALRTRDGSTSPGVSS